MVKQYVKKNRRGWIRIVEAFTAILIIAGVMLIVIANQGTRQPDTTSVISNTEISILNGIQLNNTMRAEILSTSGTVQWSNFSTAAPNTMLYIDNQRPNTIDCAAQICRQSDLCVFSSANKSISIYSESVTITSTINQFNPRVLKLFCWQRSF